MVTDTGKLLSVKGFEVFLTGTTEEFPAMLQRWLTTSEESSKTLYFILSFLR